MLVAEDIEKFLDEALKRQEERYAAESMAVRTCDQDRNAYFIRAECENDGEIFAKELCCGKEYCPKCGKKGSHAHIRRVYGAAGRGMSWYSKARKMESMGYFVFTIPERLRPGYADKASLSYLGNQIQKLMKNLGYVRGLRRWHFFGEYLPKGMVEEEFGELPEDLKYNPHLNVIVDGAFLNPCRLMMIKAAYSEILGIKYEETNVFYEYTRQPGIKVHNLMYVARATFLKTSWKPELVVDMANFRNNVTWGKKEDWNTPDVWSLEDLPGERPEKAEVNASAIESIGQSKCPICAGRLKWVTEYDRKRGCMALGVLPVTLLKFRPTESYGGGYYRILPPS